MISPMTKSGTKVVCIDAVPRHRAAWRGRLTLGNVYTIAEIAWHPQEQEAFVRLVEVKSFNPKFPDWDAGYSRRRFRYLDLPESITSCLNVQRLNAPNELERA